MIRTSDAYEHFSGLGRIVPCIYRSWHARRFVREHRLRFERTTHIDTHGVTWNEQERRGIPAAYGFEFSLLSILFMIGLIVLML
jgi:hypothetical protein